MPRLHLYPTLPDGPDPGDGGIRQVIKHQRRTLAALGWELVDSPADADVIACHAEIPPTYLRLYPDKPIVVHNHGAYWTEYDWGTSWTYASNTRGLEAIRTADIVTAVSDWTAAALRRHSLRDIRTVYHGVELDEWEPVDHAGTPYVLWNKTRVDPVCDVEPLNQVARLLPDVQFVSTFGEGPNVTVTGKLPFEEARQLVRGAAVYLCNARETFGIGTLEAMAAGVPVVGFRWGGQVEIVREGEDGFLVQPGDHAALAQAVRAALADRERLGANARERAAEFTWERAASEYDSIYAEALARRTAPGPAVSVVVPAYNLDRYLDATLQSVAEQQDVEWECVVVDDASPDLCGEIADRWAKRDPRFRVVHNETNQYLAASRNIGIAAARGRYIFPLDADDTLAPGALAQLAGALDRDRTIDIAYGNVRFVEEDGSTPHDYQHANGPGYSGWPVEFNLEWQLRGPGQLLPYASMYRRRVWEQTGGYRQRARSSEDCDFWLRTSSYGFAPRMVTTADTLIYRLRPGSMSGVGGWEEHRGWYPWTRDRALLPAAAVREVEDTRRPYPSLDPPIVAVVIPVGPGHGRYVTDAVDSVDAQRFRQWECVVVNDSGEPLPRLPVWVRVVEPEGERFGGVAAARNAGIAAARAPLFLPLDADDYLQPMALDLMFRAHVDAGECRPVVYSDWWDELEPGRYRPYLTDDYDVAIMDGRTRQAHGERRQGAVYCVTALTPKSAWEDVGGYDETLPGWEDWAFHIAMAARGVCARRVPAPLFVYRKFTGQRREENYAAFEESKRAIMAKDFGMTEGGLMACATCGGGTRTYGGTTQTAEVPEGALLIEYTGAKGGTQQYRAPSGTVYRFGGADRVKYVRPEDVQMFTARPDFRQVEPASDVWDARTPVPDIAASRTPGYTTRPAADRIDATLADAQSEDRDAQLDTAAREVEQAAGLTSAPDGPEADPAALVEDAAPRPDAPASDAVRALIRQLGTRAELNAEATRLGLQDPESLPTRETVAEAILALREMAR